jgi:hypothetical protein
MRKRRRCSWRTNASARRRRQLQVCADPPANSVWATKSSRIDFTRQNHVSTRTKCTPLAHVLRSTPQRATCASVRPHSSSLCSPYLSDTSPKGKGIARELQRRAKLLFPLSITTTIPARQQLSAHASSALRVTRVLLSLFGRPRIPRSFSIQRSSTALRRRSAASTPSTIVVHKTHTVLGAECVAVPPHCWTSEVIRMHRLQHLLAPSMIWQNAPHFQSVG